MARTNVKKHWLVKTEPDSYGIDQLAAEPRRTTAWDGVRNYQARNMLRDEMHPGHPVLIYHSSVDPPGVVGLAEVASESYPDATALDPKSPYFDERSSVDAPRWFVVDLRLVEVFPTMLTLEQLRQVPALKDMELLRRGSRLSVQPVRESEFREILRLAKSSSSKR